MGIVGEELGWWGLLARSWGGGDCWRVVGVVGIVGGGEGRDYRKQCLLSSRRSRRHCSQNKNFLMTASICCLKRLLSNLGVKGVGEMMFFYVGGWGGGDSMWCSVIH